VITSSERPTIRGTLVALVAAAAVFAASNPASAGDRQNRGRAVTHDSQTQRTDTGRTRRDTWTGPAGQTASRDAVVVNDRGAGTRTRDLTWTGPNGGQGTRQDITQRTDTGHTRVSTATNNRGETATRSVNVERDDEAGTRSRAVTATGFDGRTRTTTDTAQRTESGYTRDVSTTYRNGGTSSRSVDASYDRDSRTWTREIETEVAPPSASDTK
jgi:hypothetical protein